MQADRLGKRRDSATQSDGARQHRDQDQRNPGVPMRF
jgi:hypothetical protein